MTYCYRFEFRRNYETNLNLSNVEGAGSPIVKDSDLLLLLRRLRRLLLLWWLLMIHGRVSEPIGDPVQSHGGGIGCGALIAAAEPEPELELWVTTVAHLDRI